LGPDGFFPEIVTNLPRADIPGERVRAYLLQGERKQVLFVAYDDDLEAPEESHAAQWVIVLEGEVELTMAGEKAVYRRGDTYFVPAGAPHAARVRAGSRLLDVFDEADRYRPK
jgi:quercetin dioxygenase-like cupin family protein